MLPASYGALPLRWIASDYLHITLVPPWQCDDTELVCGVIADAASRYNSFDLHFERIGPGPQRKRPRLLWLSGRAPEALVALHRELAMRYATGQERDRAFFLHMTVARFRSDVAAVARLDERPVALSGLFDRIVLYESVLRPGGAVYREICGAGLQGM